MVLRLQNSDREGDDGKGKQGIRGVAEAANAQAAARSLASPLGLGFVALL